MGSRRTLALLTLLVTLVASSAHAGVAFKLPAGEDATPWTPYFALVGFEASETLPASGAWVELVADGGSWLVRVRTAAGVVSMRRVAPPASAVDREQIVSVANSLLNPPTWTEPSWDDLATAAPEATDPVPPVEPPPPPVVAPAPVVPKPAPVALVEPAPVAAPPEATPAEPALVESPPEPLTDAAIVDAVPPPAEAAPAPVPAPSPAEDLPPTLSTDGIARVGAARPLVGPWFRAGGGAGWRANSPPAGVVDAAGGVVVQGAWRFGAGVQLSTPTTLDQLGGPRRFGAVDLGAVLATRIPRVGTMFAVQGGAGWRIFEETGAPFEVVTVPWFGAELGWDIQPRTRRGDRVPVLIEIAAGTKFDARAVELAVQGSAADPVTMPQWSAMLSLRLLVEPTVGARAAVADGPPGSEPFAVGQESTRSEVIHPTAVSH